MAGTNQKQTELRLPPQAIDIERAILGSILIDPKALAHAVEVLDQDAFYVESHKKIYACIKDMYAHDIPVDALTVVERLRQSGMLECVGSEHYLAELSESVATSSNVTYYAEILNNKATLRRLIALSADIATDCFTQDMPVQNIVDRAGERIFDITENGHSEGLEKLEKVFGPTFEYIGAISKTNMTGVPTGYIALDSLTTGFQPGDLVILGARPSMGKTAFALNIAQNAALKHGKSIAIYSLEMPKIQLAMRMLCSEARINMQALRKGDLPKRDFPKLSAAAGPLAAANIYLDDSARTVLDVKSRSRRLKTIAPLDLIIIDYLQLMSSFNQAENRQQEISQISRSLKLLAKELKVAVIALSQLARGVELRTDKRPILADLRESGAIEQDADIVMFIYREEYYFREKEDVKGIAEIIVSKQRNGPTGIVKLAFLSDYARFDNLAQDPGFSDSGF